MKYAPTTSRRGRAGRYHRRRVMKRTSIPSTFTKRSKVITRRSQSRTPKAKTTTVAQQQLAEQLLARAKNQGVELVGPNGLLNCNVASIACTRSAADNRDSCSESSGTPFLLIEIPIIETFAGRGRCPAHNELLGVQTVVALLFAAVGVTSAPEFR